jgi:hypothetical protein
MHSVSDLMSSQKNLHSAAPGYTVKMEAASSVRIPEENALKNNGIMLNFVMKSNVKLS